MKFKKCCEEMEKRIKEKTIEVTGISNGVAGMFIYGRPTIVDGSLNLSGMRLTHFMDYCPFCGKILEKLDEVDH